MPEVHIAITRVVKQGSESEFESSLRTFVNASMSAEGMSGVHVLRPAPNSRSNEYGVLRSFETEESAKRFYASRLFKDWTSTVQPLVNGSPIRRRLTGMEAFFRSGNSSSPPRWKMAVVTFLGVLPSVLFWASLLPPVLASVHWFIVSVIVNAAVVASLTWIVMPVLTKIFHPWIHSSDHEETADDEIIGSI